MTAGGGRCETWANKLQEKIGGDIMKISPHPAKAPGAKFIGPVRTKAGEVISNNFKEHYAVRIGDRVYDRITGPQGLHIDEYRKLFDWEEGLLFDLVGK